MWSTSWSWFWGFSDKVYAKRLCIHLWLHVCNSNINNDCCYHVPVWLRGILMVVLLNSTVHLFCQTNSRHCCSNQIHTAITCALCLGCHTCPYILTRSPLTPDMHKTGSARELAPKWKLLTAVEKKEVEDRSFPSHPLDRKFQIALYMFLRRSQREGVPVAHNTE